MKLSNEDYLKQQLQTKKIMLDNLKTDNLLWIREFNVKREMLENDIDYITRQLGDK